MGLNRAFWRRGNQADPGGRPVAPHRVGGAEVLRNGVPETSAHNTEQVSISTFNCRAVDRRTRIAERSWRTNSPQPTPQTLPCMS